MFKAEIKILLEKINEYQNIIIHRHKRPDLDCLGSQMALKAYLQYNFPNKNIYAVGEDGFKEFNYIGEIDIVDDELYKKSFVIVVDTANAARVEDERYKDGAYIIKIDHHIDNGDEVYGDINIVDEESSSCCELLAYIFNQLHEFDNNLVLSDLVARNLYYGIYSDTGGFKFPNSRPQTFSTVSELVKYDWDYEDTIMHLTTYDHNVLRLVGYAYNNIVIEDGLGYIYFSQELQKELGVIPAHVSLVANFLGNIKQLKAWVVFNEYPSFIRVNIRSRSQYNIEPVAKQFDGGGHKNASGATIHNEATIKDVVKALKEVLEG